MLKRSKSQILKEIPLHQLNNLQSGFSLKISELRVTSLQQHTVSEMSSAYNERLYGRTNDKWCQFYNKYLHRLKKEIPALALTITKPSHPPTVFIMGHLKKHSQTVCSVSQRSSLCWLLFYSLQGGLFQWRYQMITYSVFPRVDVVVEASMSHCGGAGLWHATKKGSCQSSARF